MIKTLYYHTNTRKEDGLLRFKVNTVLGKFAKDGLKLLVYKKSKCSLSAGLKLNVHGVPSSESDVSVNTYMYVY